MGSEIPTIWTEKDFYTTKGTSGAKDIFGDKRFSYPKPLELITEILRAISKKDSIVLDFFAGSGTTGHAVIELNAEQHSSCLLYTSHSRMGNLPILLCNFLRLYAQSMFFRYRQYSLFSCR